MRNKLIAVAICCIASLSANAQHSAEESSPSIHWEEGMRLSNNGHYYGAYLSLDKFIESTIHDKSLADQHHLAEAKALQLICAYHLRHDGTAERITDFLKANPKSTYADRLTLLRANALVLQGRYGEAIDIYNEIDKDCLTNSENEESLLYEAISYINTGEKDKGKVLLTALRGSKKHSVDVTFYSGYIRYAEGDYEGALTDFESCANSKDYCTKAPIYIADCHLNTGYAKSAQSIAHDFRNAYPESELANEAKRIEGEAYYESGNYSKAAELLEDYVKTEPSAKRSALYRLGMCHFKTGNYAQAAPLLAKSASDKRDEMAQNAWLHAGISYLRLSNKKQAGIAFQLASDMPFDKAVQEEAMYNHALTLHDGGEMGFGESVTAFERFLNNYPNSKYRENVAKHLTDVYLTTKNYPAALASINKIKSPNGKILEAKQKVLLNMAINSMNIGKYKAAADHASSAIAIGKRDLQSLAEAYYWRGEANYRLGNYRSAFNDMSTYANTTAGRGTNYRYSFYCMGYAQFKQKQYQKAAPHFKRYTELAAKNSNIAVLSDAYNRLGDCLFDARKDSEAYDAYQKAYDTDRSQGDYSLLQLAMIAGLQGKSSEKIDLLAKMQSEYNNSQYGADALYEQGRTYIQSGDKIKSIETFSKIVQSYPNSIIAAKSANELGLLYTETGNTQKAIDSYKSVVNNYPNSAEAQTALSSLKDLYTDLGLIGDYAAIASKAGKSLTPAELDEMQLTVAKRAHNSGNYDQAINHYRQLGGQTQSADMLIEATTGEMRCAYESKRYDLCIDAATRLITDVRTTPELRAEAQFKRAEAYNITGRPAEAIADWQALSLNAATEYGAQANIQLAQYAYNTEQYKAAEDVLLKFIDSGTPHTYWLARGFILLADVYNKTDRQIDAEQYLLSLKSNYTENEEINRMIEERLK